MPLNSTPDQRLARRILGKDLGDWLDEQRHPFPDVTRSWENIAKQLDRATDSEVEVSGETIRKWHRQSVQERFVDRLDSEVGAA